MIIQWNFHTPDFKGISKKKSVIEKGCYTENTDIYPANECFWIDISDKSLIEKSQLVRWSVIWKFDCTLLPHITMSVEHGFTPNQPVFSEMVLAKHLTFSQNDGSRIEKGYYITSRLAISVGHMECISWSNELNLSVCL